ncbi:MAG: pyridoxamine 5'-phosphate oxidase [Bacteroidetes bacterium]|jgi:pyridoxamine 5'-phosphate oxidase|nr:pyridoxamine 5'-phosphate oxidase [Bacteroidota bacterium]
MNNNLENYRKSYNKSALIRSELEENPFQQFRKWFVEVDEAGNVDEANAMTISTIGQDGFPKSRVVLLKSYDENGFVFYTNYGSEKGQAILNNPNVCLSFFWPHAERQIIIKGKAEKITDEASIRYFQSRPKGSQLGALVSPQSQEIENRKVLEDRLKNLEQKYADKSVEKPKDWGGFCVEPVSFEFWQGRPNRLHDRFLYQLDNLDWNIKRLAP